MTSSNTVDYTIRDSFGKIVQEYSINILYKQNHSKILKFIPADDYTIQSSGLDEEEEQWYGEIYNLRDFIGYLKINKRL